MRAERSPEKILASACVGMFHAKVDGAAGAREDFVLDGVREAEGKGADHGSRRRQVACGLKVEENLSVCGNVHLDVVIHEGRGVEVALPLEGVNGRRALCVDGGQELVERGGCSRGGVDDHLCGSRGSSPQGLVEDVRVLDVVEAG